MRHIPVIIGISCAVCFGAELPVCEEFNGEENIVCVSGDSTAVITSVSVTGRSYEFFVKDKKAYLEISEDGGLVASSGIRALDVARIPADDPDRYISEVIDGLMDDIAWK